MTEQEVLQLAMVLTLSERAGLARQLLESLDADPIEPGVDAAWAEELEARAAANDRGETTLTDSDEVFRIARADIALRDQG